MSRVIRSRRADESRDLPLYARMLGLRHLAPNGFLCFVFLEGTVALGMLLALAELINWWGILVLPLTVAVMVKLNDAVAGVLARPVLMVRPAGMGTVAPPPRMLRPAVIPRAAGVEFAMTDEALSRARTVDLRHAVDRPGGVSGGPVTFDDASGVYGGSVADESVLGGSDPAGFVAGASGGRGRVFDGRGGARSGAAPQRLAEIDAAALNGPPASQQWADELDTREQRARQSASRRYE